MKPETPKVSETVSMAADPKRERRVYEAPAIDGSATIEPVTLGTKPRNQAGHGC
jgi:hypothetical protein